MIDIKDVFQIHNEKLDIEKKQYLLRTNGIILPITANSFQDVLQMPKEEIYQKNLEYMATQCPEIFVNNNILPKKLRIGITDFGLDCVVDFTNRHSDDAKEVWKEVEQMASDFIFDFLAIEIDVGGAYSNVLELEPVKKIVKHQEIGWHIAKESGCSFAKITTAD